MHVETTSETTVEITTEQTVEETIETVMEEQKSVVVEDTSETHVHLSADEIEEYEESQFKFRELWEKKREKVRESFDLISVPFVE